MESRNIQKLDGSNQARPQNYGPTFLSHTSSGKLFFFNWVKGYSDRMTTEVADHLAKSTVEYFTVSQTFLLIPQKILKSEFKKKMLHYLQQRWSTKHIGQNTRNLIRKYHKTFL